MSLILGILAVGTFVIFLPPLLLPYLKINEKFLGRFFACVFQRDTLWYAYYCPGGKYDAVTVGPCKNAEDALEVLASISQCDNIDNALFLSRFVFTDMPADLPKKPKMELERHEAEKYSAPVSFNIALAKWGEWRKGTYPAIGIHTPKQ